MKRYCVNLIHCEEEMQISNSTYHLGIYPLFGIILRCLYGAWTYFSLPSNTWYKSFGYKHSGFINDVVLTIYFEQDTLRTEQHYYHLGLAIKLSTELKRFKKEMVLFEIFRRSA